MDTKGNNKKAVNIAESLFYLQMQFKPKSPQLGVRTGIIKTPRDVILIAVLYN